MGLVIVGVVFFIIAIRVLPPGRINQCEKGGNEEPPSERAKLVSQSIVVKKVIVTQKSYSEPTREEKVNDYQSVTDKDTDDDSDCSDSNQSEDNSVILCVQSTTTATSNKRRKAKELKEEEKEEISISERVSMCAICWGEYKEGDYLCWSINKSCPHIYHAGCIKPWLMKSNDCPMCRSDYLKCRT